MKYILSTALLLPSLLSAQVSVSDVEFFRANPTSKTAALFMKLENTSDEAVTLQSVQSDISKRVEIHLSAMNEDGLMTMSELEDGLTIPANKCVLLQHGGLHVMFMGVNSDLEEGTPVDANLQFSDGQNIAIEALPKSMTEDGMSDHDHNHDEHTDLDHENHQMDSSEHGEHDYDEHHGEDEMMHEETSCITAVKN